MKLIVLILKNIKNLLPYFLLIALYFFLINLETRERQKNKPILKNESQINDVKSGSDNKKQFRISIPVVPYRE